MSILKNKTLGFRIGFFGAVLALVNALIYLVYTQSVRLFVPQIFLVMLAGPVVYFILLLLGEKMKWVRYCSFIPVVLYGLGLALHIADRVEMFAYMATNVYGMGEKGAILGIVILILAFSVISVIAGCVSCFAQEEKA